MGTLRSIQEGAVWYGGCTVQLKVRLLKTEVMETPLYGCVNWALILEHFTKVRTAHYNLLLRITGFQGRQRTDHHMSYAEDLKKTQCEGVGTTIRKRRLLFGRQPGNGRALSD